jgi:hypothetical protein
MGILFGSIFLLALFSFGWQISIWLRISATKERLGLAFLLSSWLFTVMMMAGYQLLNTFWLPFSVGAVSVLNVGSFLLLGKSGRQLLWASIQKVISWLKVSPRWLREWFVSLSPIEKVVVSLLFALLLLTLWSNLTWPVSDWDAIALYDFRAILIKMVGHWHDGKKLGYFYQYPPYTSLIHGALYQLGINQVKVFYTLLYSSFLFVFYALLRRRVPRAQAMIGCFLVSFAPLLTGHLTMAYTNLPYTIFFCTALLYAWEWWDKGNHSDLILSFAFVCGSLWIRQSEPFWLIILVILLWGKLKHYPQKYWGIFAALVLTFLGFKNYWPNYVTSLALPPPPASVEDLAGLLDPINLGTLIHHGFLVTDYLLTNMIRPLVLVLIPVFIMVGFDESLLKSRYLKMVIGTLVCLFGVIGAGTFYFSFTYRTWHLIGESLTRLVMFSIPLFIYLLCQSDFWQMLLSVELPKRYLPAKRSKSR